MYYFLVADGDISQYISDRKPVNWSFANIQTYLSSTSNLSIHRNFTKMVLSKRNSISTNPNSSSNSSSTNSTSNILTTEGNSGTSIPRATTSSNISTTTNKIVSEKDVKHLESECAVCSKYKEGERVLCFEPDPTKVRVVYDAKILQISVTPDEKKGKSTHEFLVHFQGWNASWDRFVPQSYLLKVTIHLVCVIL